MFNRIEPMFPPDYPPPSECGCMIGQVTAMSIDMDTKEAKKTTRLKGKGTHTLHTSDC